MAEPVKVGAEGTATNRVQICGECERTATRAEEAGRDRPLSMPVHSWVSGSIRYYGALCEKHEVLERCLRHQLTLARLENPEARQQRIDRHRKSSLPCRCEDALEYDRRVKAHDAQRKHPCASGCGRKLVEGIGRCRACTQRLASERAADYPGAR